MNKKKRVLVFVPEFPRLTETFIQREVSKLVELGNLDILVFSLEKADGKLLDNVADHVVYHRLDFSTAIKAWIYFLGKKPLVLIDSFRFLLLVKEEGLFKKLIIFAKSVGYAYLFEQYSPDHIHANFMSWPSTIE